MEKIEEAMIRVAGFAGDSIVDGPGLRFTLFMQGCDKDCPGCHNQAARPIHGGRLMGASEIFAMIEANPILSGVTFSGGEPLLQAEALIPLAKWIREKGLSLAIYTGYTFENVLEAGDAAALQLIGLADVLVDGPYVAAQKSLEIGPRGSSNQRFLDGRASVEQGRAVLSADPSWQGAASLALSR